jgi:hypothetical protein
MALEHDADAGCGSIDRDARIRSSRTSPAAVRDQPEQRACRSRWSDDRQEFPIAEAQNPAA